MLWRVVNKKVQAVADTKFSEQQLLEKDLEGWIEAHPDILGEPLFMIGRQVLVPGVNDQLDLLALDPSGNIVVIEVKRGHLNDPVDVQALRYASYISRWSRKRIEELAEGYLLQQSNGEADATFEELFNEFSSDVDAEGVPSLNEKQRIIIVGQQIKARLGSVALWLLEQGIDIKIIEITPYEDISEDALILSPQVIIPPPSIEEFEIGKKDGPADPWIRDGRTWHLEHRCKEQGRALLMKAIREIGQRFPEAVGPAWSQKYYVRFRVDGSNWLYLGTRANQLNMRLQVVADKYKSDDLAARLGIRASAKDDPLEEKLAAPTSVRILKHKGTKELLFFYIKDEALLKSDEFWSVLNEAYHDFRKGI